MVRAIPQPSRSGFIGVRPKVAWPYPSSERFKAPLAKPGNLVLNQAADLDRFRDLAKQGRANNTRLWLQLGHAGALAYAPTSRPKGPSALDLPGLRCTEMTIDRSVACPPNLR
jgi:2,4-dienoyl-CoA reductase-like NADH-dependent reductase (Old Yellow Enzyme family)